MNINISIEYIFEHKKDKDIQTKIFTMEQVENGESMTYINSMKEDGYLLVNREIKS